MNTKELPYFYINENFGGNQSWFLDPWMHIGGCGALTMCDLMIYMALYRDLPEGYPYDLSHLSKKDYKKFGAHMRPYLRPREEGIKDLETFIEGAELYLEYSEIEGVELSPFDGHHPAAEAQAVIQESIDAGLPVPMLLLKNPDPRFEFFEWHWFLIVGYRDESGDFQIKVATYGKEHWLDFEAFWETGEEERGGLVLIRDDCSSL
ncbi:MAG: hypothetical protein IJH11_09525 [Lachnospiraceae bacterium]|nr:hypothetical protein [Lachnospiraceae bacterium]